MKLTIKKLVAPTLLCLLTLLSLLGIILTSVHAESKMGDITVLNCDYNKGEKLLTIGDITKLTDRISELMSGQSTLAFCAETKDEKIKKQTVTPVLTNSLYFGHNKIKTESFKNSDIVISRTLAQKLFKTGEAVGKKLKLYGNNYTVSGVYDSRDGLFDRYFHDGKERVYINYEGIEDCQKYEINEMSYENQTQSAVTLEQMNPVNYHSTNLSEKSLVLRDFLNLAALIVYLVALVIAVKLWFYLCKRQINNIKATLEDSYSLESVRKNPRAYILLALFGAGIPLIIVSVFLICDFSIYIIPQYIPYDNIFDISHYLGEHAKAVAQLNSCALGGDKFLLNLYNGSFYALIFETVLFTISLIITAVYFYRILRKKFELS